MLEVAMKNLVPLVKGALQTLAIVTSIAALSGCGGGGSDSAAGSAVARDAAPPSDFVNLQIVPHNATFQDKTYSQWEVSFWQWALAIPLPAKPSDLPHPFADCTRPISAGQTGNVWYWSAPDIPNETCNQSATIIPAGTAIFLSMLDVEASSLDAFPFFATMADAQRHIAIEFTNDIRDLFCTIDGVPVVNVTAYRTLTDQFSFFAPTPWIFNTTGGNGTAVGDGYFLILKPLPAGPHTIHYGGRFHFLPGDFGPGQPLPPDVVKDTTLLITVGA
jgi:hypothetical protein